jgi:hypothetical protein
MMKAYVFVMADEKKADSGIKRLMNECEQLHPHLRGYLDDKLTARDRRMVARHLNLCANARKELDRLRQGVKLPPVLDRPLDVPWDQKILNWLYRPKKAQDAVPANSQTRTQKRRPAPTSQGPVEQTMAPPVKKSSLLRSPLLWLLVLLFGVILLTHLVQNAGQYRTIRSVQRWLARQGVPFCGPKSSLDLVMDVTLPHWEGDNAPVAFEYSDIIRDQEHFQVYWMLLKPDVDMPLMDFSKNYLALRVLGQKPKPGYGVKFKRVEDYSDKTVVYYDEWSPSAAATLTGETRPWTLQVIPKPPQEPLLLQKIQ